MINCFGVKAHLSELLDGTLLPGLRKEFDLHIESCPQCTQRLAHQRALIQAIAGISRQQLPLAFRQNPEQYRPRRLGWYHRSKDWRALPAPLRGGIEAIAIASGILILILMIPRARLVYETSIRDQLEALKISEFLRRTVEPQTGPTQSLAATEDSEDDVSSEYAEDSETTDDAPGAQRGEVWRINVRVANLRDAQTRAQEILAKNGASRVESGALGIDAPGGVQFDLMIALEKVSDIRKSFRTLALPDPEPADATGSDITESTKPLPLRQSFTWYKSRSKEPVPEGKARLVIWISQM